LSVVPGAGTVVVGEEQDNVGPGTHVVEYNK